MVPVIDMINGCWLKGSPMSKREQSEEFINDLANLLIEVHAIKPENLIPHQYGSALSMIAVVDKLEKTMDWCGIKPVHFCRQSVNEFREIQHNFTNTTFIHGDLWYKNVIVDKGILQGLIDWDKAQFGDPHWEFKMIRRWIGWDGLERLIFKYNASTGANLKTDYIRVLDKIALCHSYNLRVRKPNRDKPVSVIQGYIQHWPESWGQK